MKVQQIKLAFWDQNPSSSSPSPSPSPSSSSSSSSLNIIFKRLRPLAPKLTGTDATETITTLDLRSLNSPKAKFTEFQNPDASPSGGTRWNPTQEQIRMLEGLYKSGMRTPNAHQIERITAELGKYGRIEGKNVFYWFQNHKARERQKQKRSAALLALDTTPDPIMSLFSGSKVGKEEAREEWSDGSCKRKCRSWGSAGVDLEEGGGDGTLELFPLHPERGDEIVKEKSFP